MEKKIIAAILTNAAATVFAAKLNRKNALNVKLDSCGEEIFTVWQGMLDKVGKDAEPASPGGFFKYAKEEAKKVKKRDK
jgi:hypothetical protein